MHVAVYEPNNDGHRFAHVRRLLPALAALPVRVTLVTSREGRASAEYESQLRPLERSFAVDDSMPRGDPNQGKVYLGAVSNGLRRVVTDLKADHVLMPYADGVLQTAGARRLLGRFAMPPEVELEGLLMRGTFAYAPGGVRNTLRSRAWLALTQASPFRTIHHIDPIVVRAIGARSPGLARRVHLCPDPVEAYDAPDRTAARDRLGIPADGRYVGCSGYQDRRKGIDRLIRAFLRARLGPADRLLLAGRLAPEIRQIIEGEAASAVRDGRIICLARYISDEELRLSIAAADVVCTPYPPDREHCGSSSIVIHAAGQGRFVLGGDNGWVGETIRRFGLGAAVNVLDDGAFAVALERSMAAGPDFRRCAAAGRFAEFHRPENFSACLTRRLRERLGLPPLPALREWAWVEEVALTSRESPAFGGRA